ncbi:hypothetical protein FACS189490_00270 [Clostridia bacterium]|nr:hypothetical protein FACS189490_00270 [Clostridia bacterium]
MSLIMKSAYSGFKGKNNSSNCILDGVTNKILLTNSFVSCGKEICDFIRTNRPKSLVMFGQKPKTDRCWIEPIARVDNNILTTNIDVDAVYAFFRSNDVNCSISNSPTAFLCNFAYYMALDYVKTNGFDTRVVFIHIPALSQIHDLGAMKGLVASFADIL